jgi:hypothetical protein
LALELFDEKKFKNEIEKYSEKRINLSIKILSHNLNILNTKKIELLNQKLLILENSQNK